MSNCGARTKLFRQNGPHHTPRSLPLLLFTICVAVPCLALAGASVQEPAEAPDPTTVEAGREAYGLACVQCHGPSQALIQRKPAEGWRRTIYSMIGRGAPVLPDEIEPLTVYLTSLYGPTSPPPNFGDAFDEQEQLPAGGETVKAACGACHAVNLVLEAHKSESEWRETVVNMRSLGANVTDSEQELIVDYLAEYFGPE